MTGNALPGAGREGVYTRTGNEPAGPGIWLSLLVTPGTSLSGSGLLPSFCNTTFTASAGVGCLRASATPRDSIGFACIAASASSTACISAFALYLVPVLAIACCSGLSALSAAKTRGDKIRAVLARVPAMQRVKIPRLKLAISLFKAVLLRVGKFFGRSLERAKRSD